MAQALNERELAGYLQRIGDRWPLEQAMLGGAVIDDLRGAFPQRERGADYVVVLVSEQFDGVPWLERVYQAASLWDAAEMGAPADVHCYTPTELERKVATISVVQRTVQHGVNLLQG